MSIEINSLNGTTDGDGDCKVVGLIKNTGDRPLRDITVEVTLFDGDSLVGVEEDWLGNIPPGARRGFEVTSYDCWMTKFEVNVYEA